MPLTDVTFDHIAVAVADVSEATERWRSMLHTSRVSGGELPTFVNQQVALGNGGKVELIGPSGSAESSFIDGFLDRFGAGSPHHVTLKVPSLPDAIATLAAEGIELVDVAEVTPHWHESFVRPSVVGGIIVQVAWTDHDDHEYAASMGHPQPEDPDPRSPGLVALRIDHPDPPSAREVWTSLGAQVTGDDDVVTVRWPGSTVAVQIHRSTPDARPAATALVLDGLDEPVEASDVHPMLLPA